MRVPPPPVVLWSGSCAGLIEGLKEGLNKFCGKFMVLGGDRYGLVPDGDHTRGGLRTRSADACIRLNNFQHYPHGTHA